MTALSEAVDVARLKRVVRPFVGKRMRGDLSAAIDIYHSRSASMRADVRAVTDEGVTVHFYGRNELIPWSDVFEVTVSALDDRGNRIGAITYELASERTTKRKAA